MDSTDYFLKNTLLGVMQGIGARFEDEATGKSENNKIIMELLEDEKIKNRFYMALEDKLIKSLEEKYPELKGTF